MVALASTDVTITLEDQKRMIKKRRNRVKIEFGNGTLTYPSGGVPMPTFDGFGLKRNLDFLEMVDPGSGTGVIWKYDKTNNKLRGYIQGAVVSAAGAATMDDYPLNTSGDPLASTGSISLDNAQAAGTFYLGKLKEIATTAAPAAQTMYAVAEGW